MEEEDDERKPLLEPSRLSIQYPGTLTNDQCRAGAKLIANGGAVRSWVLNIKFLLVNTALRSYPSLSLLSVPGSEDGQEVSGCY